jgi:hypothetical protein
VDAGIELPARKLGAQLAVGTPPLPAPAPRLAPATLELVTEQLLNGARVGPVVTEIVTRARSQVHVRAGEQREWLFTQNPLDPTRVSGALLDHRGKTIVEYEETDLRSSLRIRGWLDVLTFRIDATAMASLRPTGRRRSGSGTTFDQLIQEKPQDGIVEAWWDAETLIPGEVTVRRGAAVTRTRLRSLRWSIDEAVLVAPSQRFPAYRVQGLDEDWRTGR